MALGGEVYAGFRDVFSKIDDVDLPLKSVKNENGESVKLTHGSYSVLMQSPNREVRKKAFKSYYGAYGKLINSITSAYNGSVKKDVFLSRARNFNSSLESALFSEDVSREVYDNLLNSVNDALPLLHRYIEDKKAALNLDTMHMYDMYVPLVDSVDLKLTYEEACKLVEESLSCLGNEYVNLLKKGFSEGWVDVFENEGKRSGAYSTSAYGVHPFVLLNYQKTTHDIFTIAHEMGHSMHSYFSAKNQPYAKADYTIFVAEVASTVNEVLLLKNILKTAKDVKLKKYLLSYYLEMIRTTLFRQTQFAEFEVYSHKKAEEGETLSKEDLSAYYLKLNKKYYGKGVVSDKEISMEWARIPHFYSAFYVYKYATGITSAITIAEKILSEGEPAVKNYFKFLSSGGSADPVSLLKIAGADLTKKETFAFAMESFRKTLSEFESLKV